MTIPGGIMFLPRFTVASLNVAEIL